MEFLTFHHPHRNEYKPFNLFVMWNNKLNIYEKEWLAVVFSSRNQSYGAYDLRRYSSVATNKALLTVLCVVALLVVWKVGYDRLPKSTEMRMVEYELPSIEEIVVPDPPAKEEPLPAVEAPIQKIAQDPPAQELIRYVEPTVTHHSKVTEDVASQDELKTKMSARITLKKVAGGSYVAEGEFGPKKEMGGITGNLDGKEVGGGASESTIPFTSVEIMPNPRGGMAEFVKWVGAGYRYPDAALEQGIKGSVVISFVVETDGSLTDIKVVRDLGFGTGEEAIRLLKKAAKWSPGIQNGRPVRVSYTLPITLSTI